MTMLTKSRSRSQALIDAGSASPEDFPIRLKDMNQVLVAEVGNVWATLLVEIFKNGLSDDYIHNGDFWLNPSSQEIMMRRSVIDELVQSFRKVESAGNLKPKRAPRITEKRVADDLASRLGGKREVRAKAGSIDILTSTEVIEVKEVDGWKSAIGQVLAYGAEYPKHSKRIHLFGSFGKTSMSTIEGVCKPLGISVTSD